jgi:heme A synthase
MNRKRAFFVSSIAFAACAFLAVLADAVEIGLSPQAGAAPAQVGSLARMIFSVASQLGFGLLVGAAALLAPSSDNGKVEDGGWPALRSLAYWTPAAVVLQAALGAGYRYGLLGLVPHVVWAFGAVLFVMMTSVFTLSQASAHRTLKRWSTALLTVASLQLVLGVTALVSRVMRENGAASSAWMVAGASAHVVTGALVLALSIGLSVHILRFVEARRGSVAEEGAPAGAGR